MNLQRAGVALGHHARKVIFVLAAPSIAAEAARVYHVQGAAPVSYSITAAMLTALLVAYVHDIHLCARCATSMPLNSQAQAERQLWALWACHWCARPFKPPFFEEWPLSRYSVIFVGWAVSTVLLGRGLGLAKSHREMYQLTFYVGLVVLFTGFCYLVHRHQQMSLWCPWCQGGGGGGGGSGEGAPVPDGPAHGKSEPRHFVAT